MSATKTPPNAPPAATTPAEQELLAQHLSEQTRSRLAGDHPERRFIRDRHPSQVLQLGVLPPLPQPDDNSHESPQDLARRIGRAPSQMGLHFVVTPDDKGAAAVSFDAAFSFYVQRYPELDHQREVAAVAVGSGGSDAGENGDAGDGEGQGGDKGNARRRSAGSSDLAEVWERFDIHIGERTLVLDTDSGTRGREFVDLDAEVRAVLDPVFREAETAYPFRTTPQLPNTAVQGSEADYRNAIREAEGDARTRPLTPPTVRVELDWQQLPDGTLKVRATLMNLTIEPRRERRKAGEHGKRARELHLFNSHLRVFEKTGVFTPTLFRQAPEDFRYAAIRTIEVLGQNCCARRLSSSEDSRRPLTTDTWPLYRQRRMVPNPDTALQLEFAELAGPGCVAALRRVAGAMDDFAAEWRRALATWPDPATKQACQDALDDFQANDIDAFARGIRCLQDDDRLAEAFQTANEVFRRAGAARPRPIKTWRLFQVVYQVIQLASLRAREVDTPELQAELDRVDVLWFPTGGGKTEAYLGLIICLLFYDRLRGKARGVSAVLRFPLRMLSVQQLQRILDVLWFAEGRRDELKLPGDPFMLGYWVGRANSPNSLANRRRKDEGDHISYWVDLIANEPEAALERRIVTRCPNPKCGGGDVRLEADADEVRLRHRCHTCGGELPVVISDDECYRYLPAVLVCTVDKLAHVGRAHQFAGVFAGPAYRCPKHGYFTHHEAWWKENQRTPEADDRCIAGELCKVPAAKYEVVPATHDPAPALQIQDESHLLEEELGTFNSHYETLLESIQRLFGTGKPTKLLAATATIEAYAEQVLHLYARDARVFPSPGWELERSFYVVTEDHAQRFYVGALPFRPDPREFGATVQRLLHEEVIHMQRDPGYGLAALQRAGLDPSRDDLWLAAELLNYELTLGYVNMKRDGDGISRRLVRAAIGDPPENLEVQVLASEVATLAKIAEVLNRIAAQYPNEPDREKRLRALVATSIVSHGVDIDALNLMVMNGMPPAIADYVQATSRSGRTHVGLVIVGYDNRRPRDRSFYEYFLKYHEFLARLIAPVPVNRFAKFAAERTVPGIMSALLLQAYNTERVNSKPKDPATALGSLANGRLFAKWWGSADAPLNKEQHFLERVLAAVGVGKTVLVPDGHGGYTRRPVFDPVMEASLREEVTAAFGRQLDRLIEQHGEGQTAMRFRPRPLTSFRDVDEPTELAPLTPFAAVERALARNWN